MTQEERPVVQVKWSTCAEFCCEVERQSTSLHKSFVLNWENGFLCYVHRKERGVVVPLSYVAHKVVT